MEPHISPSSPATTASAKSLRRQARKQAKADRQSTNPTAPLPKKIVPLTPRNPRQDILIDALNRYPVVAVTGPAGVGKTYVEARVAAIRLKNRQDPVEKIILTRSVAAPSRHRMGFLPGNADAKMMPWLLPIFEGLKAEFSAQQLDTLLKSKVIEIVPFEHMRGRTFDNAFIIGDEMQNCTFGDLRLVITRIGENSTMALSGDLDPSQIDIEDSGFEKVCAMIARHDVYAEHVAFTENDVVRSRAARDWVIAFRREDGHGDKGTLFRPH